MVSLNFNEDEILKIITALNPHKPHGYDDISIRVIKICDKSLLEPLIILFKNSTKSSHYPDIWKRSNVIPVHKKNDNDLFYQYLEKILKKLFLTKFTVFCLRKNY